MLRVNLETLVWKAIQGQLAEGAELRAQVGELRVGLLDLTAEFTDLQIEPLDPGIGKLRVEVAYGRARLPWRALIGLGRSRVHLAELRLVRPHVWTDEDFFKRPRRGRRPAKKLPIDLFIDRAEIVSGQWFHERTMKELELSASELFLVGNWAGDRRTMLGELGLSLGIHGDPLERNASVRIDSTFRWRGTNFELIRTHARGAGIELDADVNLALDGTPLLSGRGSFTADIDELDRHMQASFPDLGGRARGTVEFTLGPDPLSITGDVDVRGAVVEIFSADRARADVEYEPGVLTFSSIEASTFGGTATGEVEIALGRPARLRIDANALALDTGVLIDWLKLPLPIAGALDGDIHLIGSAGKRSWEGGGSFVGRGSSGDPERVAVGGTGNFALADGRLELQLEQGDIPSASFTLGLNADLNRSPANGQLTIDGHTTDARQTQHGVARFLDRLGIALPELLVRPLDGVGSFRTRTSFGGEVDLDLSLDLQRGAFAGQRFNRMQIDVALDESALALRRVEIVDGARSVQGTATFDREPFRLAEVDLVARRLDVAALLPLVNLETDLQGELTGQLRAVTDDGGLRGSGDLRLNNGHWFGESFEEISTDVRVAADRFHFENLRVASQALSAHGSAMLDQQAMSGSMHIDAAELDLEALSMIRGVGARLITDGNLTMDETGVNGKLNVVGEGLHVVGVPLGRFSGDVDFAAEGVKANLVGEGEAHWDADGTLGWNEGYPLRAGLRMQRAIVDLPVESQSAMWIGLTGEMELALELASPETLRVDGALNGADLHLGPHRLDLAEPAPFVLDHELLEAGPIALQGSDSDFQVSLRYDLDGQSSSSSVEGQVGLRLLSAVLPDVRATGAASVDVRARGPLDALDLSGSIDLKGGRLRYLGFPHTLEQIDMKVSLLHDEASIDDFRALLGGGELAGRGRVQLGLTGDEAIYLDVVGSNVRIALPEGFEGVYDGRLTLAGELDDAVIGGQVTMLRGLYDEEFRLGGLMSGASREYSAGDASGPIGNLGLDILVRADGNAWVRNDTAEIENHFEFRLGGTLARPELNGRLGMEEGGVLRFRDVAYRIRSGSLEFTDPVGFDPYVFLNASTSVSSYEISLRVEGKIDQLEYELSSTPSVSQQDVIALLTTGKTLQELTGNRSTSDAEFTGDMAASYFAGALTDRFEKQVQQALGLDVLQINPLLIETSDPTTRVTVGKRVRDDVLVILSADVRSTEDRLYLVEWRATNKMLVNFKRDVNGGLGTDLLYTNRFWWRKPSATGQEAVPATVPRMEEDDEDGPLHVGSVIVRGVADDEAESLKQLLPLSPQDAFSRSTMFRGVEALRRHYVRKERLRARVISRVLVDEDRPGIVDVLYEVDPGPEIHVTYDGLKKKELRRLSSEMERMWAQSLFTEDLFADSVSEIRKDFQERGFYAIDVQYDVTEGKDSQDVVFLVDRGRVVKVGRVNIHGVAEVPEARIRKQMLTRPPSVFGKGTFNPMVLEDDRGAIRNLYRDLGYLDVRLEEPRIRLNSAGDEVEISLYVNEGSRYVVESIEFEGDPVASEEQLAEWCEIHSGNTFSDSGLLEAEARIRRGLDGLGYPTAKVRGRIEIGERVVRVAFEIQSGAQMRVSEVRISGNELTRDHVILKAVRLGPGDLISREKILRAQHRLYRLDVFRNVRLSYEKAPGGDDTDYVVNVQLEEDRPLNVTVGGGYNTESKFRVSFATSYDNLHGRARSLGFQGEISDILKRVQFLMRTPRLFGAAVPGLANILWEQESREGFRVERRSTAIRADHRFNERWRAFLRYSFQRIDLLDVFDPGEVLEEKLEDVILGDVGVGLFRTTLDSLILPTRGNYFNLSFAVFAKPFLSERDFVSTQLTEMHTWSFSNGTTFVTTFRVGVAPTFGGTEVVPISERFFAGGDSTNRGFARDRLGPTLGDVDPADYALPPNVDLSQPVGGDSLLLLNQEFRFPMIRRFRLKGVVFYDAGNVFLELKDFNPLELRHTLGAGLRLETPVGPLRAEYGWKLDRRVGETGGEFHFAIGSVY